MVRVGVIGYGYWGPNVVRNFVENPGSQVTMVSDLSAERLGKASSRYPGVRVTTNHRELLQDPAVDLVAIVTPVATHYDLALQALQAGKHVLVEKPFTATTEQGLRLIEEADRRRLVLAVDHTFVYTGAVRKIRELIADKTVGDVYYYDSVRVNLGLFQHDVNVIWDLAVHDLAIMDYVLGQSPVAISATGMSHVPGKPENVAFLTLFFESNLIAHFHLNWLSPVKIRRTLIGGSQKMIVYDDMDVSEKVKVYDKGIQLTPKDRDSFYQLVVGYRTGDMWAPNLVTSEALQVEAQHIVQCIEKGEKPITDAQAGLRVVRILEGASESVKRRGNPVELKGGKTAAWSHS
jgi:predicted dehydrogenase